MLFDPARHEPLQAFEWDESRVRDCIAISRPSARSNFSAMRWRTQLRYAR